VALMVMWRTLDELAGLPAGVMPVVGPVDVVELEARCDARGRPMVLLDTGRVADKEGFMDAVSAALNLPGWFGRNWDALADCLGDVPTSTVLVWDGWTDMARIAPRETEVAIEVLADSGLTVLMVNAPDGESDEPGLETEPESASVSETSPAADDPIAYPGDNY
jgi:RNAse (barnase) inhibitor barstar